MTKIPTLYSDYRECMLDLDIYGKIVATPQQSIQELTETLFEEFQRRKPMPTLEYKRYELSRLVNPDFRIAYNKELELQDNERLLDLQSDTEVSFENIDFEDLTSLIPTTKELFSYENHVTDDMRDEIIAKYDLSTGEEFKPGISQTENIVGSVTENDNLVLSEEKIENLGVDESEDEVTMAEDPMKVESLAKKQEEVAYEIDDDEVVLEGSDENDSDSDDYADYNSDDDSEDSEDEDTSDDYDEEELDESDDDYADYNSDDSDSDEDDYGDYDESEDSEDDYDESEDSEDDYSESEDSEDDYDKSESDEESEEDEDDYEDYDVDSEDSDDYDDYDSDEESEDSNDVDYSSEEESESDVSEDDYDDYDSDDSEDDYGNYDSDTENDYGDYDSDAETSGSTDEESVEQANIGVVEESINLDDDDFDVSSFIDSVQDEPVTEKSEPIVNKSVETPITPIQVKTNAPPQSEIIDRSAEPTEIRAFLRKHPRCEYAFALKYFTKKQINDAIKIGKIIKKGNILKI